ncbi:hypothetical protein RIF29_15200 [Crotalaria pallida]|uniref:Uncharacterized protein n=1 Tax=Crotalaria pallida TaxID=3830 RepID=A0AAN9FD51_CROPI
MRKSDELALASGEHGEFVNNVGRKVVLGSKGSSFLTHQFSGANNTTTMFTDEFDSSVAILNIAIIWFHLHDYAKTLSVLEPLFQNIEPIDEALLKICIDLRLLAWIFTLNSNEDISNAFTMEDLHHLSQSCGGERWRSPLDSDDGSLYTNHELPRKA